MIYYIDGYNFLFRLEGEQTTSLEKRRESLICYLNEALSVLKASIHIVFDSSEEIREFPQCAVLKNLAVLYAPKGLCADAYIIELVDQSSKPKTITVVTSDGGLARQCQHMGAHVISINDFIAFVMKRSKKKEVGKPTFRDCSKEVERLRKIFEERLGDPGSTD